MSYLEKTRPIKSTINKTWFKKLNIEHSALYMGKLKLTQKYSVFLNVCCVLRF